VQTVGGAAIHSVSPGPEITKAVSSFTGQQATDWAESDLRNKPIIQPHDLTPDS